MRGGPTHDDLKKQHCVYLEIYVQAGLAVNSTGEGEALHLLHHVGVGFFAAFFSSYFYCSHTCQGLAGRHLLFLLRIFGETTLVYYD